MFKENSLGQGFYFKVVLDKNEKPIAMYYATDGNKKISNSTVENLKILLFDTEPAVASVNKSPMQCVTKCRRTNKCYDKPTSTGVLLCSLECGVECS